MQGDARVEGAVGQRQGPPKIGEDDGDGARPPRAPIQHGLREINPRHIVPGVEEGAELAPGAHAEVEDSRRGERQLAEDAPHAPPRLRGPEAVGPVVSPGDGIEEARRAHALPHAPRCDARDGEPPPPPGAAGPPSRRATPQYARYTAS
jgi:hypothetical protein